MHRHAQVLVCTVRSEVFPPKFPFLVDRWHSCSWWGFRWQTLWLRPSSQGWHRWNSSPAIKEDSWKRICRYEVPFTEAASQYYTFKLPIQSSTFTIFISTLLFDVSYIDMTLYFFITATGIAFHQHNLNCKNVAQTDVTTFPCRHFHGSTT